MPDELDLERGRDDDDDKGGGKPPRGQSERSGRRHRKDINERLYAIFERLAQSLEGRGDDELAGMVREDARAMVGGIVSVTKRAPGLAAPILGALAVLEPLIAFGRILRLLGRRLRERRETAEAERELELDHEREQVHPCAEGVDGCEITAPHRHEAAGVVYY